MDRKHALAVAGAMEKDQPAKYQFGVRRVSANRYLVEIEDTESGETFYAASLRGEWLPWERRSELQ